MDVFCGSHGAFLEAVVGESVHDDVVVLSDESLDDSEACEPACGVNEEGFAVPEFSQFIF